MCFRFAADLATEMRAYVAAPEASHHILTVNEQLHMREIRRLEEVRRRRRAVGCSVAISTLVILAVAAYVALGMR